MHERIIPFVIGAIVATGSPISAQTSPTPGGSGTKLLVLASSGIPISFEQIEEYSDGSKSTGKTYRDSIGSVRVEFEIRGISGQVPTPYTLLIDATNGPQNVLLGTERVAYRMPITVSAGSKLAFMDAADGQESSHKWKTTTQDLGKRTIEGIEFTGTRIVTAAEDDPRLTTKLDQWYSEKLKLIGAIDRSGPYRSYTVRIANVKYNEPSTSLFQIPSDFRILDLPLPPSAR